MFARALIYLVVIALALLALVPNSFEILRSISTGEIDLRPGDASSETPKANAATSQLAGALVVNSKTDDPAELKGARVCSEGDPPAPKIAALAQTVTYVLCTERGHIVSGPLGSWTRLESNPNSPGGNGAWLTAWRGITAPTDKAAYVAIEAKPLADGALHARQLFDALTHPTGYEGSLIDLQSRAPTAQSMELSFHRSSGPAQRALLLSFHEEQGRPYIGILCDPQCEYDRPVYVMNLPPMPSVTSPGVTQPATNPSPASISNGTR